MRVALDNSRRVGQQYERTGVERRSNKAAAATWLKDPYRSTKQQLLTKKYRATSVCLKNYITCCLANIYI
jgi:hypothetical protein